MAKFLAQKETALEGALVKEGCRAHTPLLSLISAMHRCSIITDTFYSLL